MYRSIGYVFNQPALLKQALTHRSSQKADNERLEFLGDAVLDLIISEQLFIIRETASEAELTAARAKLVKGETLAVLAQKLMLGNYLIFGYGEKKSGGKSKQSNLANAFEAIVGAVLMDSSYLKCKAVVLSIYANRFENAFYQRSQKDPKTRLQEYLQSIKIGLPSYQLELTKGPPHAPSFTVSCQTKATADVVRGTGLSLRKAEQEAADKMLHTLDIE